MFKKGILLKKDCFKKNIVSNCFKKVYCFKKGILLKKIVIKMVNCLKMVYCFISDKTVVSNEYCTLLECCDVLNTNTNNILAEVFCYWVSIIKNRDAYALYKFLIHTYHHIHAQCAHPFFSHICSSNT